MAQRRQNGETFSFITGLIVGFVVSAPIAAWLSPRSGQAMRAEIRQQGLIIRRQVKQTVRKPIEQVQEQLEHLKGDSIEEALAEGKALAARLKADHLA